MPRQSTFAYFFLVNVPRDS